MPDLTGRIALVTGANTGLGYEVARQLVFANATVMMACRELLPCHAAQRAIALEAGSIPRSCDPNQGASIHEGRRCHAGFGMVEVLDLNNLTMVAELVADLAERPEPYNRVDLLVNNAGVAAQYPLELTGDGVEGTFQANYLGHWHLTTGLLPLLERGARATGRRARVVHLTSGAHRGAPADGVPLTLDGVNDEGIGAYARYGIAKLASLSFSGELARRHGRFLVSHAVHPGVVATDMLRADNFRATISAVLGPNGGALLGGAAWAFAQLRNALFAYPPRTAALSVLYAAVAPELDDADSPNAQLIVPIATRWPPHHPKATDAKFAKDLWRFSESLVANALGVP